MEIESIETGKTAFKLVLDNGEAFEAGKAYLPPDFSGAFLCPGADLVPGDEAVLRLAAACFSAEKAALRLIARAEQYGAGLVRKLERRGHSQDAVSSVLMRLSELKLVNDGRYAELWLKPKIRGGAKGPRMLSAALRAKGINRETAEAALKTVLAAEDENGLLSRCLEKAARRIDIQNRAETRRFLKFEGFSEEAIDSYFEAEGA